MKHPKIKYLLPALCLLPLTLMAQAPRPNIILVMADDQGWGQTGYYDHPHLETPNLDAMAANGMRFDRFYAAAAVCTPTRASVLTGRIPRRAGVNGVGGTLRLEEKTLPQALKAAGYTTAHFGKWHLNGIRGGGMPVLPDDPNHPGHYGFDYWLSTTNFYDMDPLMARNGEFVYIEGESSELVVDDALEFMERTRDTPFLAVIWYGSPHRPFEAPEEYIKPFLDQGLSERQATHLAEIVGIDRSIGALRKGLRDMGIAENTVVWYCSDNGGLDDDPHSVGVLRGHKGSLWEGGLRVPGIIEWPGTIRPGVTDFPASTMDIMPTIVDLLNLPEDSMLDVVDGISLIPLFRGKTPDRGGSIAFGNGSALIDGKFKLYGHQENRRDPVDWKLFDLENDPGETTDVSGQYPERVDRMRAEAEKISASVRESAAGNDYPNGLLQPDRRGQRWASMPEYQEHFDTFEQLKPGWDAPK